MEKRMDKYQQIIGLLGVIEDGRSTDREQYIQRVRSFLQGQDFIKLGHCIQGKQWNLVMSNGNRLKMHCEELGITCFDVQLKGIRDAARHRDVNEALQIMSRITTKRVQIRNLLSEEEKTCAM